MWPEVHSKPGTVHPSKDMDSVVTITSQPRRFSILNPSSNHHNQQDTHNEVPDGLDALLKTQHLFIKQSFLPSEIFSPAETQYEVLNSEGEKIFMADETTDTSTKACCRGTKPFDVSILIRSGMYRKEVLKLDGEPRSCGCGGDITLRSTKRILGQIEHAIEWSHPHYYVKDWQGQTVLQIVGPASPSCFGSYLRPGSEFNILLSDGKTFVGKIAKYWNRKRTGTGSSDDQDDEESKILKDIWGVKFPLEMEVTHKALLLAACFLLNFQYQEDD